MPGNVLAIHEGLGSSSRVPWIRRADQTISAVEMGVLLLLGIAAALVSGLVKLRLGIPGHNILRVVFPMAVGLALVPRRGSASTMGLSAVASAAVLSLGGVTRLGAGAMTSLAVTGFIIDLALIGARPGWSVHVRLSVAGMGANIVAFLVRGGAKVLAGGLVDGQPLAVWWPEAVVTYPACGALAGLVSAAVWFRFSARLPRRDPEASA